jgi:hypothetical protein
MFSAPKTSVVYLAQGVPLSTVELVFCGAE